MRYGYNSIHFLMYKRRVMDWYWQSNCMLVSVYGSARSSRTVGECSSGLAKRMRPLSWSMMIHSVSMMIQIRFIRICHTNTDRRVCYRLPESARTFTYPGLHKPRNKNKREAKRSLSEKTSQTSHLPINRGRSNGTELETE
jgi:hypothetical protein